MSKKGKDEFKTKDILGPRGKEVIEALMSQENSNALNKNSTLDSKSESLMDKESKDNLVKDIKHMGDNGENNSEAVIMSIKQKEFEDIKFIKKHDRCCIVGFAPSWNEAPYKDKDIDFFGINELYIYLEGAQIHTPFAAWFEIHDIKNSPSKQKSKHQAFLKSCKIPLITQQHWDEYPASISYPREYIKEYFNRDFIQGKGLAGYSDYSNQISWMIALAITLEYKEIMVYGVDMAQESEYAFQKASCHFFLGVCVGRGIKLRVPSSCELLKGCIDYGFKSDNTNRFRKKKRIESQENAVFQVEQRQEEIKYIKQKIDRELSALLSIDEADIEAIRKDIETAGTQLLVSVEQRNLLSTIPTDPNEIKSKIPGLINKCNVNIAAAKSKKEGFEKELKDRLDKMDRRRRDNAVNHGLLDREFEANKAQIQQLRGHIGECHHDINNNLV